MEREDRSSRIPGARYRMKQEMNDQNRNAGMYLSVPTTTLVVMERYGFRYHVISLSDSDGSHLQSFPISGPIRGCDRNAADLDGSLPFV